MANALFGSGPVRSKNLVEFKAGRMNLKGKMVHPDKRKGLVYVYQSEDSLMHFCWKDRSNGLVEDVSDLYRNVQFYKLIYIELFFILN